MQNLLNIQQNEIVNTIKLLIYNENPNLLEKVNFEDNNVFLEPLLFAYFNLKNNNSTTTNLLNEIMQGYFIENHTVLIDQLFIESEIVYLPKIGYFRKDDKLPFEKPCFITNTGLEILKTNISLLKNVFKNSKNEIVNADEIIIDDILYKKNIYFLTKALHLIKNNTPYQYNLIKLCCKKCMMFKSNAKDLNSFAALSAHGIAFFNVNQVDYNEVFFVDDIAHQTGHIILNTLFYQRKLIYKIDDNQNINQIINIEDNRNFNTLFQALYTYYTTLLCLDDCFKSELLKEYQKQEIKARIGFYLIKCKFDLTVFQDILLIFNGIENVLCQVGIDLYVLILNKYFKVFEKWNQITSNFNYDNQTYNFSYSKFVKIN